MEYTRKLFTIPVDTAEWLESQHNQSSTVVEALELLRAHKNTVKQLASNTGRLLDLVEARQKEKVVQTAKQIYGECCGGQRPDFETEAQPCIHWRRKEDHFLNIVTGEIIPVE